MSYAVSNFWSMNQIVFDENAQAYISAAGITQSFQQWAVNELTIELKENNLWNKMWAVYPFLGGSSASHGWNLVDTTKYRMTFSNGWTHSSLGAYSNGLSTGTLGRSGTWANTGFTPSVVATNSIAVSWYRRNNLSRTTGGYDIGGYSGPVAGGGNENMGISQISSSTNAAYAAWGQTPAGFVTNTVAGRTASGFWTSQHISGTTSIWKNGTQILSGARTLGLAQIPLHLAANVVTGAWPSLTPLDYSSNGMIQYGFVSISMGLNSSELTLFNQINNRFQTKLARRI